MKFLRFPLLSVLLCSGACVAQSAPAAVSDYAPGEILVRVSPTGAASVKKFASSSGARTLQTFPKIGWQRIKLPAGTSVAAALTQYKKQSGVLAVEPNYKVYALKTPTDPRYSELYALARISAPTAWDVNTGSRDIVVAVADTGIKYDHPDLAANMWRNSKEIAGNGKDDDGNGIVDDVFGYDAFNNDGNPMDDNGHGTHCAGTIGAVGDGKGIVGVNWKVKLMALKFLGASGFSFSTEALEAYDYAIAMKKRGVNLRVISNSWGGLRKSLIMQSAMQEAAANGIISICAAGNDGISNDGKPTYPANYDVPGLVSVGATDEDDAPADFSNFGNKTVDLFAPGVNILSTGIGKGAAAYDIESGTSMACPHVAGAAALLLAQAPSLGVEEIKSRLIAAVDVLPQLKGLAVSQGRLNLGKLLSKGIYSVRGRVLDNAKKPLAGAQVFLNNDSKVAATTGVDGSYSIDGLVAGTYTVKAVLKGWSFTPNPAKVALAAKSYVGRIDLNGKASEAVYTISGSVYQVINETQRPIKDALIYLGTSTIPVAITDSTGKYTITGRAAGTYLVVAKASGFDLRAVGQLTLDGSAKVVLPATAPATSTADFAAFIADTTEPTVVVRAPIAFSTYSSGQPKRAFGTAFDVSGVDYMRFILSRPEGLGRAYYLWATKTWSGVVLPDPITGISALPPGSRLLQNFDDVSITWGVDLPVLEPLDYRFGYSCYDKLGNGPKSIDRQGNIFATFVTLPFTVEVADQNTNYPDVSILAPTAEKPILSNVATTAKGTASDTQGVDEVYVYLRRYDERGRILGYYNWVENTWVQSTNADDDVYKTLDGKGKTSLTWTLKLPLLEAGSYELGSFGRDNYGNEPPEDGSEDTLSAFSVESGVGTSSSKSPVSGGAS